MNVNEIGTQHIESIKLQDIDMPVSRVGFGGCPLGGHAWGTFDEATAIKAVKQALDLGISLFDTADVYGLGRSEQLLASALGPHRHRVCISSKGGVRRTADGRTYYDTSPKWLRRALEDSLRRLRVDHIPLYYIHWPDGKTPLAESLGELVRCRAAGKISAIGVCNINGPQLSEASDVTSLAAIQVCYNLIDRDAAESLLPTARRLGIPLITWGSLAQGLLGGRMSGTTKFDCNDRRGRYENFQGDRYLKNVASAQTLKSLAAQLGRTSAQVAVRWLLDQPGVGAVLFGAKTPNQVKENIGGVGWTLNHFTREVLRDAAATLLPKVVHDDAFPLP